MDDLEQHCEDALFQLCDARERYPIRCADELEKCIKLNNELCAINTTRNVTKIDVSFFTEEQNVFLCTDNIKQIPFVEHQDGKLHKMLDKIDNLKAIVDQIKREETCEINRLLKN